MSAVMEASCKTSSTTGRDKDVEGAAGVKGHGPTACDSVSLPSYAEYPSSRPLLNPRLLASPRPMAAFPESSSAAILSALRNLQEKIRHLELERSQAQQHLHQLNQENTHTHTSTDLECQLAAAESRCRLLEKQLEYMKKMVRNAESSRTSLLKHQVSLEKAGVVEQEEVRQKLEKLDLLEQEYQRLTHTQNHAETKIRDIEKKLLEEEHHRKLMQDKAAQLQTGLEANRILLQSVSPRPHKPAKPKKKKKAVRQQQCSSDPHYRLSLRDVPFVTGTSTGTSHSVRANVQHVLHLMKQHNRQLCNTSVLGATPLAASSSRPPKSANGKGSAGQQSSSSSSSSSSCEDLSELLVALQDEFGHMSVERQECVCQLQRCGSSRVRMELEREQERLLKRMEDKGEQIATLRRHQTQVERLRRECRGRRSKGGEVRVVTTVSAGGGVRLKSPQRPGVRSRDSLRLLKDMRSLQNSLQTH
ncbi:centrosomal protein of 57 kDa isoform X3 [Clupea harengus]|uniref:Centrosomal protein of 57 kDa isoform X3 n=1 Tax=Clupea harengus TaxID=7950 RepID=A0A6P8G2Y1_CLUHA|nr:centrosomal protein of 57 kDa isoform X3 [Clupea harengus]